MIFGGLQKLTLIDFPGKTACTVFSLGCNFYCPWCYNPELVLPEKIKQLYPVKSSKAGVSKGQFNGAGISEREFFEFLEDRRGLLEGVVVCGGEPTIQKDLPNFIKKIKKLEFAVKLDTNGSNPKMLRKLIDDNLIDYVAMDIKVPKEKYNLVFGSKVDVKKIEESIKILKENKVDYEFRTTVVPTVLAKEDIIKIANWIGPAKKYYLQNFRPEKTVDPRFEKIKPYPQEFLLEIQKAVSPLFEICQIR